MLWLCMTLPQLPLDALCCTEEARPTLVTMVERNARWVVCCNSAAERLNLRASMNYTVALAIASASVTFERNMAAERSALHRLAAWAYQFSASVIIGEPSSELRFAHHACIWLEIGASLKLFGGFRKLIERIEQELKPLRYTYQLGVAPTLEGAALLARAGIRIAAVNSQSLRAHIQTLPITALPLPPEAPQQLEMAGVRSIGLLLELPRDGVARRFGPQVSRYLDRLIGAAPDPRTPYQLPAEYESSFDFEMEVRSTQALLFTLQRLLREFLGFLRARDTGVQHFTLQLTHRDVHDTTLLIGLSAPERNAELFFSVVRERLERTQLPAPTTALTLRATQFAAPIALQPEMFSGVLQQRETLSHTLDRITARLGDAQVHGLRSVADHRPELSWAESSPQEEHHSLHFTERPLWLLPEPQPLQRSVMPQIVSAPERIEGGWWDGGDVQRDYFIARTTTGADLWIFHDLNNQGWYLHGFWS